MIEDALEKDLKESAFIQICDFISFFVHLYYKTRYGKLPLPNRIGRLIDNEIVGCVMATFEKKGILNTKASGEVWTGNLSEKKHHLRHIRTFSGSPISSH
jgi:hypothetical protein